MVKTLAVRSIIDAIGGAAGAWSDRLFAPRQAALDAVGARTGYSKPVVEIAFDRLFASMSSEAIAAVIVDELGSLDVLDRFVNSDARYSKRAVPIGRVCVISSRTTIGVGIIPAIFALCAKCRVLVKDREDHLAAAFFSTLSEMHAELGELAAARPWQGEYDAVDLDSFDSVVAFGSDRTLSALSARLRFPTRLIAHPSKTSVAYLTPESLTNEACAESLARAAAVDMLLYDGEGCLSLRALFIERGAGISPERFCEILALAIERAAAEFPAMPSAQASARLAMARDVAAFRSAPANRMHTNTEANYLLLLDPPLDEPPLSLPRTLSVYSVDDPSEAIAYLQGHAIALEALAVAGANAGFRDLANSLGAARLTHLGSLQAPALGTFHGGRPRIAEFVRWIVDET